MVEPLIVYAEGDNFMILAGVHDIWGHLAISAWKKEKSRPPPDFAFAVPSPAVHGLPPPPDRIHHQLLTKRPDQ